LSPIKDSKNFNRSWAGSLRCQIGKVQSSIVDILDVQQQIMARVTWDAATASISSIEACRSSPVF
jgi:hypothetical protein